MKNIISERELKRMVKKVVREEKLNNMNEDRTDFEMSGARSRKDYVSNPRERDISSMFGKYSEDVPPIVIRYLRKNPEAIVKRLYKIYGDKIFDYLPQQELEETVDSEKDERYFIKNKKRKNTSHLPGFHKPALGEDELGEGYDSYMDDVPRPPKERPSRRPSMPPTEEPNLNQDKYLKPRGLEEEDWIQNAVEKPGSLRKKMGLKKDQKLSLSDIRNKMAELKRKDKDPKKKGVQGLSKRDLKTYRQLNLAKTLRGL